MGSAEVIVSFRDVAKCVSVLNTTTSKSPAIQEFDLFGYSARGECLLRRAAQPHQVALVERKTERKPEANLFIEHVCPNSKKHRIFADPAHMHWISKCTVMPVGQGCLTGRQRFWARLTEHGSSTAAQLTTCWDPNSRFSCRYKTDERCLLVTDQNSFFVR